MNKKVLIVDDTKATRLSLQEELLKEDYDVDLISNGEEALKKLETNDYDLIFLDYNLPGMNGVEIYKRVRTSSPETKVILISGYLQDLLIAGRDITFIHKPFHKGEIVSTVKKLVEVNGG